MLISPPIERPKLASLDAPSARMKWAATRLNVEDPPPRISTQNTYALVYGRRACLRRAPRQRLGDRQEIEYAADQSPQQNGNDLIALSFCFQHTQFPLCHFSAPDTRFLAKDPALWKQGGVFHIAGGEK